MARAVSVSCAIIRHHVELGLDTHLSTQPFSTPIASRVCGGEGARRLGYGRSLARGEPRVPFPAHIDIRYAACLLHVTSRHATHTPTHSPTPPVTWAP